MRPNKATFIFTLLLVTAISIYSPLQPGMQTVFAASQIPLSIQDIPAQELPVEPFSPPIKATDSTYISQYNQAVEYYNNNHYDQAIPILEKLTSKYNDKGQTLYMLGTSYFSNAEYEPAINTLCHATIAGYDKAKTDRFIYNCLVSISNIYSEKANYTKAIAYSKAALLYQKQPALEHNVVYYYLKLANQLPGPDRVMMLLYAYDFIKEHDFRDESLATIANYICNNALKPPLYDLFDRVIDCVNDALSQADDPYLHQSLGFIYLYQNNLVLAKAEFKQVVYHYKGTEFYSACFEKYNEIGNAVYHYQVTYPLQVRARTGAVSSIKARVTVHLPQTYDYQTVSNLKVSFNQQNISYQTVVDNFGTHYLVVAIEGKFQRGQNELTVASDVGVYQKRFTKNILDGLQISDYRRNEPRYRLLTQRNEVMDLDNPQIQRMAAEIRQQVKGDRLLDTVRAVYDYVIKLMEYNMVDRSYEKVSVERALKNTRTAICEDYAVITVALLRALKIPASYFSGDSYDRDNPVGHAWAVFYTPAYHPIPLDTTWGDTSGTPDLYFLTTSSLNITNSFSCESNFLPNNTGFSLEETSDPGITVTLGILEAKMEKTSR